jgi:hypothetical protein
LRNIYKIVGFLALTGVLIGLFFASKSPPGKVAVEVGGEKDLVPTLELIKTAVLNGELDTQIEAAANKLRDGFAQ